MKKKCDLQEAFDNVISLEIKRTRENRKISQDVLCSKSGISRVTLIGWEKGVKTPNSFDLYNVVKELYDTPSEFWDNVSGKFEKEAAPKRFAMERAKYNEYIRAVKKRNSSK